MNIQSLSKEKSTGSLSVIVFLQESDFDKNKSDIEKLSNKPNVHVVLQPCPYEGIEFLYQFEFDIENGKISTQKDMFWHAIAFMRILDENELQQFSNVHHRVLVAILNQDSQAILKERVLLNALMERLG